MRLIKWEPFQDMERLFDDNVSLFSFPKLSWDLAVDVYEDKENVIAEMNLPGINPDKVDVSIEGDYLRITGSRDEKEEKKDKNYYHKEIRHGSFERTIRLPVEVKKNGTEAEYKDGVLKITMSKKEEEKGEKVKIKVTK